MKSFEIKMIYLFKLFRKFELSLLLIYKYKKTAEVINTIKCQKSYSLKSEDV